MALTSGRRRSGDDADPAPQTGTLLHSDVRRTSRHTTAVSLLTAALLATGGLVAVSASAAVPAPVDVVVADGDDGVDDDTHAPAPGRATAVRSADRASATVTWTPSSAVTGAEVAGYDVAAVAATTSTAQEQAVIGKRISSATASATSLSGLVADETYRFEVRSVDAAGASGAPAVATVVTSAPTGTDDEAPTVTATPGPGTFAAPVQVTLTSSDPSAHVYWAKDVPALEVDVPSDQSRLYTEPVTIDGTRTVELHWVVFDDDGRHRAGSATYAYRGPDAPAPVPSAPRDIAVSTDAAARTATVSWRPPARDADVVTGYEVLLDDVAVARADRTATSQVLRGLRPDEPHTVEVVALGPNGDSPAASASFTLPSADAGPPGAPRSVVATAGHESVTVIWTAAAIRPDAPVARFDVEALDAAGKRAGAVVSVLASAPLSARIGGLVNGREYTIRVTAVTAAGRTASTDSTRVTPHDVITVDTAEFRTDKDEWRVDGRSRAPGSTIRIVAHIGGRSVPLGSVSVRLDGRWDYREQGSAADRRATRDTRVTLTSSTGASAERAVELRD